MAPSVDALKATCRMRRRFKRRLSMRDRANPKIIAGASSAANISVRWSNAPTQARAVRDMMAPTRKKALMVPRIWDFDEPCHTRAIGGPPMDVAVPRIPEAAPAAATVRGRGFGRQPQMLSMTPKSTAPASVSASPRAGRITTNRAPSAVPGTRPRRAQPAPAKFMVVRSRMTPSVVAPAASSTRDPGSSVGSISAITGAAISPSPNPIAPCKHEATTITVAMMTSSAPLTFALSQAGYGNSGRACFLEALGRKPAGPRGMRHAGRRCHGGLQGCAPADSQLLASDGLPVRTQD